MRLTLAASIFALAVLAAACGGGGKSGMLPSSPGQPSGPSGPSGAMSHFAVSLKFPPATQQANARKPFLLSSSTQSIEFGVVPQGQGTPTPAEWQLFSIAAPACQTNATTGVETCTFTVQAPFGTDIFYVETFSVTTPTATSIALASFNSGPIVVPSPGSSSPPASLSFVVNGVVASVKLTVASADPLTSNNQIFTASVASTPQTLGITPFDATGTPILAQTFASPGITISVSPAPAGVGLVFTPTCATSSSSVGRSTKRRALLATSSTITIGCAADLANVQYVYDGTVGFDPNQHIADTYTISAAQLVSPAPSPATISLASTIVTQQVATGPFEYSWEEPTLQTMPNGTLLYAYSYGGGTPALGTFDPATQTLSPPATFNGISGLFGSSALTVAPNGTLWVAEGSSGLYCYSSVANAMSGAAPTIAGAFPKIPAASNDNLWIEGVAADSAGNLWYVGWDSDYDGPGPGPQVYAGYLNTSSGCVATGATASFFLNSAYNDEPVYVTALPSGGIAVQNTFYYPVNGNALYVIKTTSPSTIPAIFPALADGYSSGLAADGAGNIYGAFSTQSAADIESMASGGSALTSLTSLPPTAGSAFPTPEPTAMAAFGPNGGAADRLAYIDSNNGLGLIENLPASPMPLLVNLPNVYQSLATTYATDGTEYVLYSDASTNLYLAHILTTRTWSVASTQVTNFCNDGFPQLVGILERSDSGPFSFSVSGGSVAATPMPGTDHDYLLTNLASSSGSFNVTIGDSHGRTETIPFTSTENSDTCGIARRHPQPPH
jgi:hypothetical protein